MALVVVPGREALSVEEFLRQFGASDGVQLGLDLLRDAVQRRDATDVELALVVCFRFGFLAAHVDLLIHLAFADWHQRHEDVATALGTTGSPTAVDALLHLAEWVPRYLEFDDARALAVKAIWALGTIADDQAQQALKQLASADSNIVAQAALHQLQK